MPKWRNNDKEAKICKNWSHCQVLKTLLMWKASDSSNARLFNWSTFQLVDCSTDRLFNWSTVHLIDSSPDLLFNLSTVQLVDSSTCRQFNLSTVQLIDSSTRRLIRVSFTRAIYLAMMSQPFQHCIEPENTHHRVTFRRAGLHFDLFRSSQTGHKL